jgi:dihydrolipoamide dehydrogenase
MVVGNLNASEGCEVLVIGGGPGGYLCAIRAAQLGKDVILVEKRATLGGVCLNEGCIPSKALIHASETLEQITHHGKTMGIRLNEAPTMDFQALQDWKNSVVKRLTGGVNSLEKAHGVRVMQGTASFKSRNQVDLTDAEGSVIQVDFDHAVIATGTVPIELPHIPTDGEFVIGSREALNLTECPEHLVVIGGGYIGLELGTAWAKFGANVTVVELQSELLGGTLEPEIHRLLKKRAKAIGLNVLTNHKAMGVTAGSPGSVQVLNDKGEESSISADKVLVAVGRRPYFEGLGLENTGIQLTEDGFIPVDETRRTPVSNIFAIGDVTGNPMLAHKAYREAKVAAEVIAGEPAAYDVRVVPAVMFVDPEIASVGYTEAEAKAAGYNVVTGTFPFAASGRALSLGATDGLTKVVADEDSERILGVHVAGPHAAELIGEGTLAIELDAFLDDIGNTIHAHPTLSESILEAAELALGTCAHFKAPKKR